MKKVSHVLNNRSVRLAVSYLGIIMVLSLSFSVIFYRTSTGGLNFELKSAAKDPAVNNGHAKEQGAPPTNGASDQGLSLGLETKDGRLDSASVASSDVAGLNAQLREQVTAVRTNLIKRLILLNLGALVIGGMLSYYLARRTLRPIEAMMDVQSRFAADASHELRTPLTVMQSEIEVALTKPNLTLKRATAALESTYQEVLRLRQLSEGLLRLTHADKSTAHFAHIRLDELISDAINNTVKLARAKHIAISDDAPAIKMSGDAQSLTQALVILLDNAIKYSPKKSAIHITGHAEGKRVVIRVSDAGPGIPTADLSHIFERFYRADTSRSSQHVHGHGLGLSIAQKIIEQHRGKISVTSTPGKGSTFTVTLPA